MSFSLVNKYARSSVRGAAGFTLIEVMITMAILGFISLGIFEATTSSFKLREEINADGEFYTGIRVAMGIMNRDISAIYSPTVLLPPKSTTPNPNGANPQNPYAPPSPPSFGGNNGQSDRGLSQFDPSKLPSNVASDMAQSYTFWSAAVENSGLRPAHFIGTANKMSFISASNYRIYKDSPESIFDKVTYEISTDTGKPINGFKVEDSSMLVRTTSADVFDNDDSKDKDSEHTYTMLRGLLHCKFTYYKWDDTSFKKYDSWDSDQEDFKNKMPDMIEISYTIKGPTGLSYDGDYKFRPEMPLDGLNPSF